jgi:MoaA/NifB/PqqE/SkfB family radical SAM enzyme
MKPCRRVGLDVTWRCTWRCTHCFYAHGYTNEHGGLGTPYDVPMETLLAKVDKARARGIDHVVLEGWGEPTLFPKLGDLLLACRSRGLTTSIITNGVQPTSHYAKMYYDWGLDHLHISSHGFGDVLNQIAARPDAAAKQLRLKEWLHKEQLPFRTNLTIQQANYKQMPEALERDSDLGAFHVVMLGFLPHYEWSDPKKTAEVGVHPELLRPYIEETCRRMVERNQFFTIRYHPFCHLDPKYWKYIVNTHMVLWDVFEWNYDLQADDLVSLRRSAEKMGEGTRTTDPCNRCIARPHCGGWNKRNVEGVGCTLTAIEHIPQEYANVWNTYGGIHDLNPVNHMDGITPPFARDSRRNRSTNLPPIEVEVIEEAYEAPILNAPLPTKGMSLPLIGD